MNYDTIKYYVTPQTVLGESLLNEKNVHIVSQKQIWK